MCQVSLVRSCWLHFDYVGCNREFIFLLSSCCKLRLTSCPNYTRLELEFDKHLTLQTPSHILVSSYMCKHHISTCILYSVYHWAQSPPTPGCTGSHQLPARSPANICLVGWGSMQVSRRHIFSHFWPCQHMSAFGCPSPLPAISTIDSSSKELLAWRVDCLLQHKF